MCFDCDNQSTIYNRGWIVEQPLVYIKVLSYIGSVQVAQTLVTDSLSKAKKISFLTYTSTYTILPLDGAARNYLLIYMNK